MNHLTQEILKDYVSYDPFTGIMTRTHAYHKSKVGKIASSINKKGHLQMAVGPYGNFLVHRLAWLYSYGQWPADQVDHIDGDKANNRLSNLREATNAQNSQNRYAATSWNKSSGLLGVSLHKKTGKWQAAIRIGSTRKYLGLYTTPDAAHEVYLRAKAELHPFGEVAKGYRK